MQVVSLFPETFRIIALSFENEINKIIMKIKKEVLEKVADSHGCRRKLMEVLDISHPTMSRYISDNDDNLTKAVAMKVIGQYFNLSADEILEDEKTAA